MRCSTNIANYCSTHIGYCDTLHEDQRRFVVLIIVTVFSKIRTEAEEAVILLTQTIFFREVHAEPEEERAASVMNRRPRVLTMRDRL